MSIRGNPYEGRIIYRLFKCPDDFLAYLIGKMVGSWNVINMHERKAELYLKFTYLRTQGNARRKTAAFWALTIKSSQSQKSSQVSIMGDIYRAAEITYAWIGSHATTETKASVHKPDRLAVLLATLRLLDLSISSQTPKLGPTDDPPSDSRTRLPLEELTLNSNEKLHFIAALAEAAKLFTTSYFRRVWILQELVLSRHVELNFGPDELELATVLRICTAKGYTTHSRQDCIHMTHLL